MNEYYRAPSLSSRTYSNRDLFARASLPILSENVFTAIEENGRMSAVRRFFCLFVTFDFIFIALLWLISVVITGETLKHAVDQQILHYSIYSSSFDIVVVAGCRFMTLILFYAILYINHWIIIALSTSSSCAFLITKVFLYDWTLYQEPIFHVILVLTSFVLSWGEAWFLDCRVLPEERFASLIGLSGVNPSINSANPNPLLSPFLQNLPNVPESTANFYSPYESSDDEDLNEEYVRMGVECIHKSYLLLSESIGWKTEKVTSGGDTIKSYYKEGIGKIYKLTGNLNYPAKELLKELFDNVEQVVSWNPTLLESRIIKKIDNQTDISYQVTAPSGGGLIKPRDFVNLRCWRLIEKGRIVSSFDSDESSPVGSEAGNMIGTRDIESDGWEAGLRISQSQRLIRSDMPVFDSLSKSLGAKQFSYDSPNIQQNIRECRFPNNVIPNRSKTYLISAASIEHAAVPVNKGVVRGQNKVSCIALSELREKPTECLFEWILCIDLKGFIPKTVLDSSYSSFMQLYMTHLRSRIEQLSASSVLSSSSTTKIV